MQLRLINKGNLHKQRYLQALKLAFDRKHISRNDYYTLRREYLGE